MAQLQQVSQKAWRNKARKEGMKRQEGNQEYDWIEKQTLNNERWV